MSFSLAAYKAAYGDAWHPKGNEIARLLTHVEYAGDPTNNVVPDFIGQFCFDTANAAFYQATSLVAAGWKKTTA